MSQAATGGATMSFPAAMDSIQLLGFRSCRMNFPPKSPQSARSRPPRSFFISEFQLPAFQLYQNAPFFPATSFSPAMVRSAARS